MYMSTFHQDFSQLIFHQGGAWPPWSPLKIAYGCNQPNFDAWANSGQPDSSATGSLALNCSFLYEQYGVLKAYIVHTEYCTQTNYSYNYEQQLLLRNSALNFLKQPLITVER